MHIITAGRTAPNRAVRFGGDLSLDDGGRRSLLRFRDRDLAGPIGSLDSIVCGPEVATGESARLLFGSVPVDDALRTLDVGAWTGRAPEEIDPGELAVWFTDPGWAGHGGESIAGFVHRIHTWRDQAHAVPLAVVAMPVAQALLADDPAGYFAVEVRPAALHHL
ncbi:histidine phosphatase family protein [Gordonia sp. ABSL1-1]|uniref:histidine phosphatase family protein n=1 Tax=Gordonia sp. ABSL1-1 TaxID=3053923 RepID=UPI0025727FB2|nr:histidine phosphatase family protein [Gordonia sp. ABSL1-1]MDL9937135.1 histidine phosphatase family protein [Gordonia sp. ABSL1-1]